MEDKMVFYDEHGIKVTDTRFIYDGRTYAMSLITSIRTEKETSLRKVAFVFSLAGFMMLYITTGKFATALTNFTGGRINAILIALIIIVIGIWKLIKREYTTVLHSASGESDGPTFTNKKGANKFVNAVNEAIISRG